MKFNGSAIRTYPKFGIVMACDDKCKHFSVQQSTGAICSKTHSPKMDG